MDWRGLGKARLSPDCSFLSQNPNPALARSLFEGMMGAHEFRFSSR